MNTIRKFVEVKNNTLNIVLPDNFKAKRVEVIIISNETELLDKTKKLLDDRIQHHIKNPTDVVEFDEFLLELEKDL